MHATFGLTDNYLYVNKPAPTRCLAISVYLITQLEWRRIDVRANLSVTACAGPTGTTPRI